ncbi:hypothetical protein F53441_11655 [Fusarium austroafricanum]|uniref:Uncharacterized protein n=1 Tax=Fusarium austroafricanum TaxID=2364996 RepID=A0A8H4K3T3_9HYPO|nr:hypothetical protein F53441_11655 [Fusarium austroafricanum]
MAPTCSDPRQIVITLNPARRQALLKLVDEATSYMSDQLEASDDELGPILSTPRNESGPSTPRDENRSLTPGNDGPERNAQQQPNKPSAQALRIQKAAIKHMKEWKKEFTPKLEEIVRVKDDHKIQEERRKHQQAAEKRKLDTPEEGENLISFGEVKVDKSEDITSLQALYHPIPTRLTTIPAADRREALSCILLLLLSTGKYSAHTRALALYLASSLGIPQTFIVKEEMEIAKTLLESSKDQDKQQEVMSAEAEASKRREENKFSRFWKVGLASVAGAAVIGVTGGLAAPIVAGAVGSILGGVGLGGVASFLGIFWMNGALVGALFGAYGGKMTGEMMDKYAKEVEDFRFIPLKGEWGEVFDAEQDQAQAQRRLRVTIGINGWLRDEDDVTKPWRILSDDTEVFALRYEMKSLIALGHALRNMVESFAWKKLKIEIIKRTVFATLLAALWPIQLLAAASNIDNPFGHAHNRSRKAGQLLADALINKVQGERPVTLVGYSLGATAIHACLQSLAERHAFGLIDSVVIIGAPAPSAPPHWRTLRTVVSGKIFNVYSENDLILGFVYRAHSLSMGVSGLQNIQEVEGIQNLDLSDSVSGHLRYPDLIGEILNKCGFVGIKAASEIEKDELILMKDRHAEGELIDFEGTTVEGNKSPQSPSQEQIEKDLHGLNISPPALVSPSQPPNHEQEQSPQESGSQNPPLPQRPAAQDKDEAPKLPRRPVASQAQHSSGPDDGEATPPLPRRPTEPQQEDKPAIPRRPVGADKEVNPPLPRRRIESSHDTHQQQRPGTPESNFTDDEEYGNIVMVSYDSDNRWRGTGHSLHKTDDSIGLAKPLLLNRKDNTKGLGQKQHFTSDQWWMNAFDEQLKGIDTSKKGKVIQTVTTGKLNVLDKNLGKYSVYSTFVRGGFLEGTIDKLTIKDSSEESSESESSDQQADKSGKDKPRKETKEEKKARKEAKRKRKEARAAKRAEKAARRELKAKSKKSSKSSAESSDADEEKRRRRARKEEKRRKRAKEGGK